MKFFSWKNTSIIVAIVSIISGGVLASQWNKFEVKDETFSCTIGDPLPFQVLVGLLFFMGFSLMLGSNIYVYYKTKKCEKAITKYLGENPELIDERIRQHNEARMHLESQFSRTVRWIFLTFIVLHFPSKKYFDNSYTYSSEIRGSCLKVKCSSFAITYILYFSPKECHEILKSGLLKYRICQTKIFYFYFPILDAILMVANPMPPNKDLVGLHIMGYWGSWISMFINPFVYFITNDFFKTATIKTFGNENFIQISTKRNTTVAEQEGFFGTVDRKNRNRINKIDVEMEQQQDIH